MFEPLTAFDADCASGMMAALLLWDLREGKIKGTEHPMLALNTKACHGGNWYCAYTVRFKLHLVLSP